MKIDNGLLTSHGLDLLVLGMGKGLSYTEKVELLATQAHTSPRTIWNYLKTGAKKGAINAQLVAIAQQHGIISTPASEGE